MASQAGPSTTTQIEHPPVDKPDRSPEDVEYCRICRGEASPEEPLFYPCKCSGSIKFVHQECLMEWLSHSQKKYCELCKTPFRFTKLYHPGMPSRIPTSVFIRRATIHVMKMLVTWCRGVLVASVWLIILPWCMRVVWRSLFWVGDGGWSAQDWRSDTPAQKETAPSPFDLGGTHSAAVSARAPTTSASLPLPTLLMPYSQTLNFTRDSVAWTIIKTFFFDITHPLSEAPRMLDSNATFVNATTEALAHRNPSLLSDISLFNWFSSQAANRFVIDVLEGQIITLLVVVAFILIFLIREWVVQQQPVMNMVALNDAHGADRAHDPAGPEMENEHADDAEEEAERVFDEVPVADNPEPNEGAIGEEPPALPPSLRFRRSSSTRRKAILRAWQDSNEIPEELRRAMRDGSAEDVAKIIARMPLEESIKVKDQLIKISERFSEDRTSIPENERIDEADEIEAEASSSSRPDTQYSGNTQLGLEEDDELDAADLSNCLQRPNMPARNRSFMAAEIRRSMEEGSSWSFDSVPQMSEEESQPVEEHEDIIPDSWEDEENGKLHPVEDIQERGISDHEEDSENSSGSWQQVPEIVIDDSSLQPNGTAPSVDKGKARVVDEVPIHIKSFSPNLSPEAPETIIDSMPRSSEATDQDDGTEDDLDMTNESTCGSDSYRLGSDSEGEATNTEQEHEQEEDVELAHDHGPQLAQPPRRLIDWILDWVFGDIAPGVVAAADDANDEHIVHDLAEEAPFVPFANNEPQDLNPPAQDPEVAAAAAQAGIDVNDQEALDDAEDLEGIMELIGMQGPIIGLFQNAMFSAVLISATLACAVWFPYLCGKVVILLVGSPISVFIKFPLRFVATLADLVVDAALCAGATALFWLARLLILAVGLLTWGSLSESAGGILGAIAGPARSVAESSMGRLHQLAIESTQFPHPDYFRLSINSHVALRTIQNTTSSALHQTRDAIGTFLENFSAETASASVLDILHQLPVALRNSIECLTRHTAAFSSWVLNSKSYKVTLDFDSGINATPTFIAMEQWTSTDRMIAVLAGYACFALVGALYLKRASPISTSQQGRKIEGIVADILQQAGGVLKVILIISIEMLAFPLYCGLLLDIAMLPLFFNGTLYARWRFTCESPWTSCFVHWFIGTCYMFHFALFVSMCRKIMRKGVLYFIRDPDDPTFHPVRDVLERSVTTQLRKIAFSALVYGALVIVCLGGVVWSLNAATTGILPIQWTSHAPSFEFPLDLLFYNFLTPLVIKVFQPSNGLHSIYKWWFKRCARQLRLTNFLFGEKAKDEEGHHVRPTWTGWLTGEKGDPENPVMGDQDRHARVENGVLSWFSPTKEGNTRAYFQFDGRYVRAPASDQVRIPKGEKVFVEVDQHNQRKDGLFEEVGVHNSDLVTPVYVPPWFRVRTAIFVFAIWIFASITGVGCTIIPLIFGRYMLSTLLPLTIQVNDIHAFSFGAYTLGTVAYGLYHLYKLAASVNGPMPSPLSTLWKVTKSATNFGLRVVRFGYVWTSLIFVIPFLFALLLELYFLMPLHAYLGPHEPHVVHLIQDWTLGFLYARLAARVLFSNRTSRAARAFAAVITDGYFNPNARLATRCFLLPVTVLFLVAIMVPSVLAFSLNRTLWAGASEVVKARVWRFSFPAVGVVGAAAWAAREGMGGLKRWRGVVRDEVYLIGERLHNFGGERKEGGKT
ncbi:hypothetical protein P154DRAFT_519561 [Amniculicola lignicola CBS 123094]|uniref:RING-type E3 ubiquitin transferase n=1 Tax=Amniculicola lignicola CBS 123094 TaxID=1392246 RepID=A0A6A5WXZ9_9PLEO|nr:hypothetical protein P154DRAFT_519561 [Amniculicola lignicola CBS 123094]